MGLSDKIKFKLFSGKNSKLAYYIRQYWLNFTPLLYCEFSEVGTWISWTKLRSKGLTMSTLWDVSIIITDYSLIALQVLICGKKNLFLWENNEWYVKKSIS